MVLKPTPDEIKRVTRAELREEVERELTDEIRTSIRKELEAERKKWVVTSEERRGAHEFVRELEFECFALARAASDGADQLEKSLADSRPIRRGLMYFLLIGFLPAIFAAFRQLGWHAETFALWAVVIIPWCVAGIISIATTVLSAESGAGSIKALRVKSIEYHAIVDEAKRVRLTKIGSAERMDQLDDYCLSLRTQKDRSDKDFLVSAQATAAARRVARDLLVEEMDPERLFRVQADDVNEGEQEVRTEKRRA